MASDTELEPMPQAEPDINPMFHVIAPIAAIAATMVVRKILNTSYERSSGHQPPLSRDPRVPFMRAVMWTAATTAAAAVAEVVVYRIIIRIGERS